MLRKDNNNMDNINNIMSN